MSPAGGWSPPSSTAWSSASPTGCWPWPSATVRTGGEAANWVANLPGWASIAYGLFVIGYYVLLEGYLGQTLGKLATGIKVVSEATGATPGIGAAAIRTVLRIIDGLFSYLVALITRARLGQAATAGRHGRPHPRGPRLAERRLATPQPADRLPSAVGGPPSRA